MVAEVEWERQAMAQLRSVFGFDSFRPLQREIVLSVMGGRDVFVLMPTGGGKSLCYQLPALLRDGPTVVVSPLIALMKDQVDALRALGVAATFINSSLDSSEIRRRQLAVARGEVKLLYVAPERLVQPGFLHLLNTARPAFFAIDEAHCISEWGHDFRPEYRELKQLRDLFPGVSLGAFTATATRRVQADIIAQLRLEEAATFRASFNRANLYYEVRPKKSALQQLVPWLHQRQGQSGIIYCLSRNSTEELATVLRAEGFSATAYHAGLEADERRRRQEQFIRDDVRIVVATIAFGMGIDKPDVRFVVHYDLPRNLEGYYQESGRAGRDGEPADCLLFYSYADLIRYQRFVDEKATDEERKTAERQLRQMANWAANTTCRRRALLAYFDDQLSNEDALAEPDHCCDVCSLPRDEQDCTDEARLFLECARRTGEAFGSAYLIDLLRGAQNERTERYRHHRLPVYGKGRDRTRDEWRLLVEELVRAGYVERGDYSAIKLTNRGRAVLLRQERVRLALIRRPASRRPAKDLSSAPAQRPAPAQPVTPAQSALLAPTEPAAAEALFTELRALRKRLADDRGVPPYVIFPDSVLRQMAQTLPANQAVLLRIHGVGERKAQNFGEAFLRAVADFARRHGLAPLPHSPVTTPAPPSPPAPGVQPVDPAPGRRPLNASQLRTLDLFNQGHTPAEIAAMRDLSPVTIESHLADALLAGHPVDLDRLVPAHRRRAISAAIDAVGGDLLKPIMEHLGEGYTYSELKLVRAALAGSAHQA